jgi:hypothetical protein
MTVLPRLRRTARLIPMPALERRIEEINQHYQIHGNEGFEEISYETVGDILPYINEGELLEEKKSVCLQDLKKLIDELP